MNLSTQIDFDIKRFFQWWARGLAYWLPEKIKPLFSEPLHSVFLTVTDGTLTFKLIEEGQEQVIAQLDLSGVTAENFQQLLLNCFHRLVL